MNKLLLIILDGFGIGPLNEHNAIYQAHTPFFDSLIQKHPHTVLHASGTAVGTLPGQIGTSEIGHLTIGAGRIVYQNIARIHNAINDASFFQNPAFLSSVNHAKQHGSTLHLIGLVSPGGVHSHSKHLYALLKFAKDQGVNRVAIHAMLDGRDTPPSSALAYMQELENILRTFPPSYLIATIMGRFYGMDRNQNWERTKRAWSTMANSEGNRFENAQEAIRASYAAGVTDEFIEPCTLVPKNSPYLIQDNDSVIFFNFRADRMRQLVSMPRHSLKNSHLTSMTAYCDTPNDIAVAFPPIHITNHLTETLSRANIAQCKIAETEKYAHLTYFLNGGIEATYPREDRRMIESSRAEHFEKTPRMSSQEITIELLHTLTKGTSGFIAVNFCNADMLGHTGNISAAIEGISFLDVCLSRIIPAARATGYEVVVTADHGNAEEMYIPKIGSTHTAHTLNKVPFVLLSDRVFELKPEGTLANVAPTVLQLMGIEKPPEMTGTPLIAKGNIL